MLTVTIPGLRLVSEANMRENGFVRAKRTRDQKGVMARVLDLQRNVFPAHPAPLVVTITRVGVGEMDSDNAEGSAKHVRDAIAKWLGRSDGPKGCVEWRVEQRKSGKPKTYWVEVRIETAYEARGSRREEVA